MPNVVGWSKIGQLHSQSDAKLAMFREKKIRATESWPKSTGDSRESRHNKYVARSSLAHRDRSRTLVGYDFHLFLPMILWLVWDHGRTNRYSNGLTTNYTIYTSRNLENLSVSAAMVANHISWLTYPRGSTATIWVQCVCKQTRKGNNDFAKPYSARSRRTETIDSGLLVVGYIVSNSTFPCLSIARIAYISNDDTEFGLFFLSIQHNRYILGTYSV